MNNKKQVIREEVNRIIKKEREELLDNLWKVILTLLSICGGFTWILIGTYLAPTFADKFVEVGQSYMMFVYSFGVVGGAMTPILLAFNYIFEKKAGASK